MKILNIFKIVLLFSIPIFGQQNYTDTIPTRFWDVDENETYTYISTNTGLYILERDSNNIFREIYNMKDSLDLLHIHKNYLISGDGNRLKIFNLDNPTNPNPILDTLLNYPIYGFDDFYHYFVIRSTIGVNIYKFVLADCIDNSFDVVYDSDTGSPNLSQYYASSDFSYPYAFLIYFSPLWQADTVKVYRYDITTQNFTRLSSNFIFPNAFSIGAAAYKDTLFTCEWYPDPYGNPVYYQYKYGIDTISNSFNYISYYWYSDTWLRDINSFVIITPEPRKYDLSLYHLDIPDGSNKNYHLTEQNMYRVQRFEQLGPEFIYYSSRVTTDSIIFKQIFPDPPTNVVERKNIIIKYQLYQNYPNPFNPTTTIKYQIPELSFVTIKVYDVLGNEIVVLVNEEKPAGEYEVEFYGTGIVSGIYFYRLRTGSFVETKKMVRRWFY